MVENLSINQGPEAAPSQGDACKHHWMIESPNGATSPGRCKKCGDERPFVNFQLDKPYQRHFRGEPVATENQGRGYYRETEAVPVDSERIAKTILPKNGTIGGRF